MGRYVTGDFDWKFAFGSQSSSFGEVLDEITMNSDMDNYTSRFIGTDEQGEKVELSINHVAELVDLIDDYIGKDFKVIEWDNKDSYSNEEEKEKGATQEYWDKLMIWKFRRDVLFKEGLIDLNLNDAYLNFYVEY